MRRFVTVFSAIAASALLSLVAVPHAFGTLSLPAAATVSLDAGVDAVLATHNPTKFQVRAMHRVEKYLRPGRRVVLQPHRCINDAKRIVVAIGSRFETEIANPDFGVDVCNEIGGWVDGVGQDIGDAAVNAGRRNERRIARAFDKAERLFAQGVDARDHGNGPKTLQKLSKCMKQFQKVARFLAVDIDNL